ncbi:hypothetical protein RLDS_07135 [Sphingobium lactosutens DS20]|uniref:Uncharacterized protein n=1 Tax=Sphingobium lactosutens DS20 TaxID=1331060 RepID=T0HWQ5_9SPHN|nr:hypothetical protein RLDS_07135 [Sphingobium lactosutens DS20]
MGQRYQIDPESAKICAAKVGLKNITSKRPPAIHIAETIGSFVQ